MLAFSATAGLLGRPTPSYCAVNSNAVALKYYQLVVPFELMWPSGVLCTRSETMELFA